MATKKTTKPEEGEENIQNTQETPISVDGIRGGEWDIKETITVPRARGGAPKTIPVSINGRQFLVPTGKTLEVPKPVAEVLREAQRFSEMSEEYEEAVTREATK